MRSFQFIGFICHAKKFAFPQEKEGRQYHNILC